MPETEEIGRWIENRFIIMALIVIVILVISSVILLYFWSSSHQGPFSQTRDTEKERMMGFVLNNCTEDGKDDIEIFPFIEDDIGLCDAQKNKEQCRFNYYLLNIFEGADFDGCNDIDVEKAKTFCDSFIDEDASNCENMPTAFGAAVCRAVITGELSECQKLAQETESKACANMFHIYRGVSSKNVNECENMQELDEKAEYTWFSSQKYFCLFVVRKNTSFYMQELGEYCRWHIVSALHESMCDVLESENDAQECKAKIANILACVYSSDPKSCINSIIDISFFCQTPTEVEREEDLFYKKFKFVEDNPDICITE